MIFTSISLIEDKNGEINTLQTDNRYEKEQDFMEQI